MIEPTVLGKAIAKKHDEGEWARESRGQLINIRSAGAVYIETRQQGLNSFYLNEIRQNLTCSPTPPHLPPRPLPTLNQRKMEGK